MSFLWAGKISVIYFFFPVGWLLLLLLLLLVNAHVPRCHSSTSTQSHMHMSIYSANNKHQLGRTASEQRVSQAVSATNDGPRDQDPKQIIVCLATSPNAFKFDLYEIKFDQSPDRPQIEGGADYFSLSKLCQCVKHFLFYLQFFFSVSRVMVMMITLFLKQRTQ